MTLALLLLAVLQGLTEFLPISSSGHLLLLSDLLQLPLSPALRQSLFVWLHVSSLLAIATWLVRGHRRSMGERLTWRHAAALLPLCVPAALAGLWVHARGGVFGSLLPAGVGWLVTASLLWAAGRMRRRASSAPTWSLTATRTFPVGPLLCVGLAQAAALLPGLSRSGATISTSLLLGMDRGEAIRLSFLSALPLIAGAAGLEAGHAGRLVAEVGAWPVAVSFLLCYAVSLLALSVLERTVRAGRIDLFAPYCVLLAAAALARALGS